MIQGNLQMGIEDEGDWVSFHKFFKVASNGKKLQRQLKYSFRDFLRSYRLWALKGILTEGAAVGASWWPTMTGGPTGYRTGNYARAIENMRIRMKKDSVTLTFQPGALLTKSHKGGYRLALYMSLFEYGGPNQPPRPLWSLAFKKAGGMRKLNKMSLKAVKRTFNKEGLYNIVIKIT